MSVRAKFTCINVEDKQGTVYDANDGTMSSGLYRRFTFLPVYGGSDENKKFFAATPSGEITIDCVRQDVVFERGKEYYVDFSPAEVVAPVEGNV